MTLNKLKSTPLLLIEDDVNKNIKPLLLELSQYERNNVSIFCYEQPVNLWRNVFKNSPNVKYYDKFDFEEFYNYPNKSCIIVDSVNQMALNLGWSQCIKSINCLKNNSNIERIILIIHKDCLSHYSKIQAYLNHIANSIVSFCGDDSSTIKIIIKKNNKVYKGKEKLTYDIKTRTLKTATEVIKDDCKKYEENVKSLPGNLTTFKIEVDQIEKMEKYKLKLPYMSKINEGESKVYYEPDAVDDWDDEDPDEDLDI